MRSLYILFLAGDSLWLFLISLDFEDKLKFKLKKLQKSVFVHNCSAAMLSALQANSVGRLIVVKAKNKKAVIKTSQRVHYGW